MIIVFGVAVVAASLAASRGAEATTTASVTVTSSILSATSLNASGCASGTSNITDFGAVQPGTSTVTSSDCNVTWGSSNDTSMLRLYQQGGAGSGSGAAMWSYGAGTLDPTFDGDSGTGNGVVRVGVGTDADFARAVKVLPDGRTVVAGYLYTGVGANADVAVLRLTANGALDTTFDGDSGTGNGKVTFSVGTADKIEAMALQPDGKIVLVGSSDGDHLIVRLNANGTLDTTFDGPSGIGNGIVKVSVSAFGEGATAVALQADARIVVMGFARDASNDSDFTLLRLNVDGSLDSSFDGDSGTGNGIVTTRPGESATGREVMIDAAGRLLVAGWGYWDAGGLENYVVQRFLTDGTLDTSYGTGGTAQADMTTSDDLLRGAVLQADGKVVVIGEIDAGDWHIGVARFTSGGALDPTFGTGGKLDLAVPVAGYGEGRSIYQQADGKLLLASYTWDSGDKLVMTRLTSSGALDLGYGTAGFVAMSLGDEIDSFSPRFGLDQTADGRIVVAIANKNPDYDMTMLRFDSTRVEQFGTADWSAGSNMFGACLRAVTGAGVTGTWTLNATCPSTNGTYWNAIAATSSDPGAKVAGSTTSGTDNATVSLRFGFRSAPSQPPGTYMASLVFEVVAPNV